MLIAQTNSVINTPDRFIAVSRPRRFGKSMAADMLAAYYDKSVDSSELFNKFKIAQAPSFDYYINKYSVIKLNVQNFLSDSNSIDEMLKFIFIKEMIKTLLRDIWTLSEVY